MFRVMTKRVLVVSAAVIFLFIAGAVIWKQAFGTYVTETQVWRLIQEHLPIGSNKSEIEVFVDSLRIDRVTTTNLGYRINEKSSVLSQEQIKLASPNPQALKASPTSP